MEQKVPTEKELLYQIGTIDERIKDLRARLLGLNIGDFVDTNAKIYNLIAQRNRISRQIEQLKLKRRH